MIIIEKCVLGHYKNPIKLKDASPYINIPVRRKRSIAHIILKLQ